MWKFFVKMIGTTGEFINEYSEIDAAISGIENINAIGYGAYLIVTLDNENEVC